MKEKEERHENIRKSLYKKNEESRVITSIEKRDKEQEVINSKYHEACKDAENINCLDWANQLSKIVDNLEADPPLGKTQGEMESILFSVYQAINWLQRANYALQQLQFGGR